MTFALCLSGTEAAQAYNQSKGYVDREGRYTCAGKTNILVRVMLTALFVFGCVAAGGVLSPAAAGWTAVGGGGAALLMQLAGGNLRNRKADLIVGGLFAISLITVGSLGGAGILTGAQVGYCLIGILAGEALLYCCAWRCYEESKRVQHKD
ncbi:MAG: hypothetical protein S4CHLAM2_12120 [Chlamydiales bacterium]|nr:hypothetical protein [Chlamydiales bacterium]